MAKYTLIASRDPFESQDVQTVYQWAQELKQNGNEVMLFLVQNGVLQCRRQCAAPLKTLIDFGVTVYADGYSLRERGITKENLIEGIKSSGLGVIVDHMAEGRKIIWH